MLSRLELVLVEFNNSLSPNQTPFLGLPTACMTSLPALCIHAYISPRAREAAAVQVQAYKLFVTRSSLITSWRSGKMKLEQEPLFLLIRFSIHELI